MADALDISEVVRLTGLTSRAFRFYEARGLVRPLRTASGRRYYGPAELERVNQIVALKRAALSLAQIQRWGKGGGRSTSARSSPRSSRRSTPARRSSPRPGPCSSSSSPASTTASPSMPRPSAR